jgi:uncharacterized protein (TIGR03546 family)
VILIWCAKILAVFNANVRPSEIAGGIALALLAALVPAGNLLWFGLLLVVFIVKVNQAIFFVFLAIFKLIAFIFDPALDALGYVILTTPALQNLFIEMANTPLVPWTRYNETLVMGGLVGGILAFIPTVVLSILLIKVWRNKLHALLVNSKIYKAFMSWPVISSLAKLGGKILNISKELI